MQKISSLSRQGPLEVPESITEDYGVPSWIGKEGLKAGQAIKAALFSDLAGAHLDHPLVILESPVKDWPAFQKWSPSYFQENVETFQKVTKLLGEANKEGLRVFVYKSSSRLLEDVVPVETSTSVVNLPPEDFFGGENLYLSRNWNGFSFAERLDSDIQPRDFMQLSDIAETHMWAGKRGVVTGAHYDSYHNLYAQVYGCKRFVISSPDTFENYFVYPFHHPHDRQSQRESPNFVAKNKETRIPATVVDLRPGDLFYLPPFHFHRVSPFPCEGMEQSISINTWSEPDDTKALFAELESKLPRQFRAKESATREYRMELLGAFALYLKELSKGSKRDFLGHIVERYTATKELGKSLGCNDWKRTKCPKEVLEASPTDQRLYQNATASAKNILSTMKSYEIHESVEFIMLCKFRPSLFSVIYIIYLFNFFFAADYAERVLTYTVGNNACAFLLCTLGNSANNNNKDDL